MSPGSRRGTPRPHGARARHQEGSTCPDDEGYDDARRVWNAAIDRRPAVVVQCTSAVDVAAAVGFARAQGLEIAVRGGAHSIPGHSAVDGGRVIDVHRMDGVTVDPVARRARVQGGALMAAVDAAPQVHALAVPMRLVSRRCGRT